MEMGQLQWHVAGGRCCELTNGMDRMSIGKFFGIIAEEKLVICQ